MAEASSAASTAPAAPADPASLADPPRVDQRILHNGKEFKTVREGMAYILIEPNAATSTDPKKRGKGDDDEQKPSVFYNPIQQFNRDLSVLAIRAHGEDFLASKTKKYAQERLKERRKTERKRKAHSEKEGAAEGNDNKRAKVNDEAETGAAEGASPAPAGAGATADQTAGEPQQEPQQEPQPNGSSKGPKFRILDALSATGLRALRYAHEIPFATSVTGNDLSPSAIEVMKLNIKHNKLEHKITPVIGNAVAHMYQFVGQEGIGGPGPKYDAIDLDPYGTAVPFLDGAVQAVSDGGLLCVTCTDAGVFNSNGYPEKAYSQYGGLPIKGHHSHEGGLRLILHAIATAAAKYGISIEPLLSLSIDYYARVFVRVRKSPAEVKFLAGKQMLVYNCDSGCGAWTTQYLARNHVQVGKKGTEFFKYSLAQGPSAPPQCPHCGFKTHLSGPMWGGPLHNPAFIEKVLSYLPSVDKGTYQTTDRIEGMLRTAHEELLFDAPSPYARTSSSSDPAPPAADEIPKMDPAIVDHHPFYFNVSQLSRILHCQALPDAAFKGALRRLGYRTTRSHCRPGTVKTDAPWEVVWEVMREWVRQRSPVHDDKFRVNTPGRGVWDRRRRPVVEDVEMAEGDGKEGEKQAESTGVGEKSAEQGEKEAEAEGGEGESAESEPQVIVDKIEKQWTLADGMEKLHKLEIVFDEKLGKDREVKKVVRYQMNPRANWGPMGRAK